MEELPVTKVRVIGHHGLVASILDKTKLIERIDSLIPKRGHPVNITHGQAIAAIIINNLSCDKRQLYGLGRFFEDKPIELFLGNGVTSEMVNYDVMARSLDAIIAFGVSDWFFNIAMPVVLDAGIPLRDIHVDTTSKVLHGKYKNTGGSDINIVKGHSKDHRPDLNQIMLALATNGGGTPIWMKPLSGNASDSESLQHTILTVDKLKKLMGITHDFIYVADAAIYLKEYLLTTKHKTSIQWITRVPESLKIAKEFMRTDKTFFDWDDSSCCNENKKKESARLTLLF
jgi:transposase